MLKKISVSLNKRTSELRLSNLPNGTEEQTRLQYISLIV